MNTPGSQAALRQIVRDEIHAALAETVTWPETLNQALPSWLEVNPPTLPISQITGFSQFTVLSSEIDTSETTSSTGYTDLATVGPSLSGFPDGNYILMYGATMSNGDGINNLVSPLINLTGPSDTDAASVQGVIGITVIASVGRLKVQQFTNGSLNSVTLQYRVDGATTGTFYNRWLVALKYSNL